MHAPLNDDEYEQLDDLLHAIGPQAMDVAQLEGLLTALVVGPQEVPEQQWLPRVWGVGADASHSAIDAAAALVRRHHAYMGTWMAQEPSSFEPIYECGGAWTAEAWTAGFAAGMALQGDAWAPLAAAQPALLAPFEHAGDDWQAAVTPAVIAINAHWHPNAGRAGKQAPKAAKVGRNDPCPCGSGKKYKKCCDAG